MSPCAFHLTLQIVQSTDREQESSLADISNCLIMSPFMLPHHATAACLRKDLLAQTA